MHDDPWGGTRPLPRDPRATIPAVGVTNRPGTAARGGRIEAEMKGQAGGVARATPHL
jgi:hypothetical protein